LMERMAKRPLDEFFQFVRPHLPDKHYEVLVKFMEGLQQETLEELKKARVALPDLPKCREFTSVAEKKVDKRQRIEMAYMEAAAKRNEQLLELLKKKLETEI